MPFLERRFQPITIISLSRRYALIALAATFVVGFYLIFQPFQFRFYDWGEKLQVALGFGGITALSFWLTAILLPALCPNWFRPAVWGVKQEIIWLVLSLSLVALGCFTFKTGLGFYPFSWERGISAWGAALAIGTMPGGAYLLYRSRHHEPLAVPTGPSQLAPVVELSAERGNQTLRLHPHQIGCLNAQGNYVEIWYWQEESWQTLTLRTRLGRLAELLQPYKVVFPCHRSCWVNPAWVAELSGTSRGGQFRLLNQAASLPISRTYFSDIREKWEAAQSIPS
ncbi:MAG: LytTR family DNA-binding domain-containing protein [Bacteroidota bacterium]